MLQLFPAPAPPAAFAPGTSVTSSMHLRYEDVTMNGHLIPIAAPAGLAAIWREVLVDHPGARNALALGILPILTRLTIHASDHAIRVDCPVETRTGFVLAHDRADGEVTRLFMNIWCELSGVAGRLGHGAPGTERAIAARVFAEHTFTRPLATSEHRKVTRLAVDGFPEVPELHYAQPAASTAAELPDGATWLDELDEDRFDYVLTLDQTDSNQHVNSLVYIRLFAEAVNRRLARRRLPLRVHTRAVDIGYRKPCFAGDRVRAHLRLFRIGAEIGASGTIVGADGKDRCYVRVLLGA